MNTLSALGMVAFALGCVDAAPRFNVLYLISDDLRPEIAAQGYGQTQALTPNINKLAATGTVFSRAYCQQAVCVASRNSFMTGRRPHHTNVFLGSGGSDFRVSGKDVNGPGANWTTLPGHFKAHNYSTLGGGKTFHPKSPPNFDYPTSWTDWRPRQAGNVSANYFDYSYWLTPKHTHNKYPGPCPGFPLPNASLNNATKALSGNIAVWCALDEPDGNFYDHGLADDTIARLRYAAQDLNQTGRPFFIASGFARPHTPWRVPQRFWDMYITEDIRLATHKLPPPNMPGVSWQAHSFFNASTSEVWLFNISTPLPDPIAQLARHGYYASVSWMDYQVGRILDELAALGLENTTAVALHGDHGWQLGEHNSWHKYTNFELGARVPLIIRAPMIPASQGTVAHGLAELVDVYPTLAELAGTPPPTDHLDGVSLVPFLRHPAQRFIPTSPSQGTMNKTLAFSQYPHNDQGPDCPVLACPFYGADGSCHQGPKGSKLEAAANRTTSFMGFSVRDDSWRYTVWLPFNGTRADWNVTRDAEAGHMFEELYNHTVGADNGTDFDAMDTDNLAYQPAHGVTVRAYFAKAREFFNVIAPPTLPPASDGCQPFCFKHKFTWKEKCHWVHCAACKLCRNTTSL